MNRFARDTAATPRLTLLDAVALLRGRLERAGAVVTVLPDGSWAVQYRDGDAAAVNNLIDAHEEEMRCHTRELSPDTCRNFAATRGT